MAYIRSVKVLWDRAKDLAKRKKHGVSFEEASELLVSGVDHLEIFDEAHSDDEDRFISIGPIARAWCSWSGRSGKTRRSGSSAPVGPPHLNSHCSAPT
jgi:hypothetical protein